MRPRFGEAHPLDEVSVLLTTGFGAGLQRLARKGIEAMMTEEKRLTLLWIRLS